MAWKWDPKIAEQVTKAEEKAKQAIRYGFLKAGFVQDKNKIWYKEEKK